MLRSSPRELFACLACGLGRRLCLPACQPGGTSAGRSWTLDAGLDARRCGCVCGLRRRRKSCVSAVPARRRHSASLERNEDEKVRRSEFEACGRRGRRLVRRLVAIQGSSGCDGKAEFHFVRLIGGSDESWEHRRCEFGRRGGVCPILCAFSCRVTGQCVSDPNIAGRRHINRSSQRPATSTASASATHHKLYVRLHTPHHLAASPYSASGRAWRYVAMSTPGAETRPSLAIPPRDALTYNLCTRTLYAPYHPTLCKPAISERPTRWAAVQDIGQGARPVYGPRYTFVRTDLWAHRVRVRKYLLTSTIKTVHVLPVGRGDRRI